MAIVLGRPEVDGLDPVLAAHRDWQQPGAPMQLHPGDLGWQWRFGVDKLAASLRTWSRDGELLALGFLDEPTVLRMAIAPHAETDEELSHALAHDIADTGRGVLPAGELALEVRGDALVRDLLAERGWVPDEPWTQLSHDLKRPLTSPGLRVEVVGPDDVQPRTAVQRAAFPNSTFTEERWHTMAAGPLYADARCLVGYDEQGTPVAAVTVWSAGPGRPGLLEPMGVHRDHRGQGHGRAITVAAAAALQELGASSATVCTPSANTGGVATYVSVGFTQTAEVRDLARR